MSRRHLLLEPVDAGLASFEIALLLRLGRERFPFLTGPPRRESPPRYGGAAVRDALLVDASTLRDAAIWT